MTYPGERVFVTRSLVADSHRKNRVRYDELASALLVGEYDQSGALLQEIVWLGDIPVASIRTNESGAGVGVFYIHTDHLNTPRKMTRPSDNAVVWRWDADPFGNGPSSEDPDGNGKVVTFNLRFAGQYADAETGLYYNYFRYFDPQTGRYITSDPIGLAGGINTYAYVNDNPISYFDPNGQNWFRFVLTAAGAGWSTYQGYEAGEKYAEERCKTNAKFAEREANADTWTPAQNVARRAEQIDNVLSTYGAIGLKAFVGIGLAGAGGGKEGVIVSLLGGSAGFYVGQHDKKCGCE